MKETSALLLLIFVIFTTPAQATHLLGGQLYWEANTPQTGRAVIEVYYYCGQGQAGISTSVSVTVSWLGSTVSCSRVQDFSVNAPCTNNQQPRCNPVSYSQGTIRVAKFRSPLITLPNFIPSSGLTLSLETCCLGQSIDNFNIPGTANIALETTIFPHAHSTHSSAYIVDHDFFLPGSNALLNTGKIWDIEDSLHYQFYTPIRNLSPINLYYFHAGFSEQQPLPNTNTHGSNGPVTLDPHTGKLSYDIQQASGEYFPYGLMLERWNGRKLISRMKALQVGYYGNIHDPQNQPPSVQLTSQNHNLISTGSNQYSVTAYIGDTLKLKTLATDLDKDSLLGQEFPQVVSFSVQSYAMDPIRNYTHRPDFQPVGNQMGWNDTTTNEMEMTWLLGAEHLDGEAQKTHTFWFEFKDNSCAIPAKTLAQLEVKVEMPSTVLVDTILACQGDSVSVGGESVSNANFWSPGHLFADSTSSGTTFLADSSRVIYFHDSLYSQYPDSVVVLVSPRNNFSLNQSNNELLLSTDLPPAVDRIWKFNRLPFLHPDSALTPFGTGLYAATASHQYCQYQEEIFTSQYAHYTNFDTTQGVLHTSPGQNGLNWAMGFNVTDSAAGELRYIYLPGLAYTPNRLGARILHLELYDQNNNSLWSLDTIWRGEEFGVMTIPLRQEIQSQQDYTLRVEGGSGVNHRWLSQYNTPYRPWGDALEITGLWQGPSGIKPGNPTNKLLPLSLAIGPDIGLDENPLSEVLVYPNPSRNRILIQNLPDGTHLRLYDLRGQLLLESHPATSSWELERPGKAGIYLLQMRSARSQKSMKLHWQ